MAGAGSTAVLLCVPEAEPIVHAWRSNGDPSAARGTEPAVFPFGPSEQ